MGPRRPHANATVALQSNYHGTAPFVVSPLAGLSRYAPNVTLALGADISSGDTSQIPYAVTVAKAASTVVLFIGLDGTQEGEEHGRYSLALPGAQERLLVAVAEVAVEPIIVVVISGGPVDLTSAKANPKVGAILIAGYHGEQGGLAIAQTIFGENNPSGRLTQTWYPKAFVDNSSMFDMNMRPNGKCPGRSYRFYTGTPVYSFGTGLSYTTFEYSGFSVRTHTYTYTHDANANATLSVGLVDGLVAETAHRPHTAAVVASVSVNVTNTGDRTGAETVLGFVSPPTAGSSITGAPIRSLKTYRKVLLVPGDVKRVNLDFTAHDLAYASRDGGTFQSEAGVWELVVGGTANKVHVGI